MLNHFTVSRKLKRYFGQIVKGGFIVFAASLTILGIRKLTSHSEKQNHESPDKAIITEATLEHGFSQAPPLHLPETFAIQNPHGNPKLITQPLEPEISDRSYDSTETEIPLSKFSFLGLLPHKTPSSTDNISIVVLRGSHHEMGVQYGQQMKNKLTAVLGIIKKYFVDTHAIPYTNLIEKANIFYGRYSYSYQTFLHGMSRGSGLSVDDCKVLNGMETLNSLIRESHTGECAFLFIPPNKTREKSAIIGRNYDFPEPFDECAKYLTVTVVHEENKMPTAFISMPGQIYCPSCINSGSLFMELNNGEPSGGFFVDHQRQSLLINLLEIMQNSDNYFQIESQLKATQSDYSLIINTANNQTTRSFEFSSTHGMRPYIPTSDEVFVSTNFFLNTTWPNLPTPTDNTTWFGVTRRNNLLSLASSSREHTAETIQTIMDQKIEHGGAAWNYTIYQIIFDTSDSSLYLKATQHQSNWTRIQLEKLFNQKAPSVFDNCFWKIAISGISSSIITGMLIWGVRHHKKFKQEASINENDTSPLLDI